MGALLTKIAFAGNSKRRGAAGLSLAIALIALLGGCDHSPAYPHARIVGSVSIDGKPVEQGTISYFSDQSAGHRFGKAKINHGEYELTEVPLGDVVFTFSASAETGKTIAGPGGVPEAERVNLIPKKYGSEGVTRDISEDGTQDFQIANSP
jgi:hypothetical protein